MRAKVVGVLLAGLLLAVPPAALAQGSGDGGSQGETSDVTFYGHVYSAGLQAPMPANTEAPIGEANLGLGFGVNCKDTGPDLPGVPAPFLPTNDWQHCDEEPFNKLALFSTAGPVDVQNRAEFVQNGGYGQLHNERGQTKPVVLDTGGSITATVYGTWDTHGWAVGAFNPYGTNCMGPHPGNVPCLYPYWGWDPGVYEDVVMEATLYHADLGERTNSSQAPPVQEAVMSGDATVVAEGQWGPNQVMNGLPGSPNAWEWNVELGSPTVEEIPNSDDFFLVFSTHQETAADSICFDCPMRWWAGEFFPPSFDLPVKNAFQVERTIPSFANGKLAVLGIMEAPWGSYDLDPETVDLEIDGPQGSVSPTAIDRFSDFSVAHGGHFEPVNVTWIWDYRKDDAQPGEYSVTVSANNIQNNAPSACTASFTLESGESGRLVPGDTETGKCGIQGKQTQEKAEEVQEGVNETGG